MTATYPGKLIVIEGADGSGRTTQVNLLTQWLEREGYYVENTRLKQSKLVADELSSAQQGTVLGRTTMSLFYATDFADQLENRILPALRSGAVVVCDRYIYTLMARDIVRGADREWLHHLYDFALIPNLIIYLKVDADLLLARNFKNQSVLNYWESGMDIGLSADRYDSFMEYQNQINQAFLSLENQYNLTVVNANLDADSLFHSLKQLVERTLNNE